MYLRLLCLKMTVEPLYSWWLIAVIDYDKFIDF